jgi:hypothetical protein
LSTGAPFDGMKKTPKAPDMYKVWRDKEDRVTKIVIDPWAERGAA